jgi:hypothetical protein
MIVKMLKFSQNTFSKELNFVKENKESIKMFKKYSIFLHGIFRFILINWQACVEAALVPRYL